MPTKKERLEEEAAIAAQEEVQEVTAPVDTGEHEPDNELVRELMEDAAYEDDDVYDGDKDEDIDPAIVKSQGDMSLRELEEVLSINDNKIDKEIKELQRQHADVSRTYEEWRASLRKQVRWLYDAQRLRIAAAGRINRSTGTVTQLSEFDMTVMRLRAKQLLRWEKKVELDLTNVLQGIPAYTEILAIRPKYWGIGARMAGVILSEFDIRRQDTCSKMWAFAGLAPEPALKCSVCGITIPNDLSAAWKSKLHEDHKIKMATKKAAMIEVLMSQGTPKPKAVKETAEYYKNYVAPVYKPAPYDLLIPKRHPRTKCAKGGQIMTFDDCVEGKKGAKRVAGFLGHYNSWLRTKLVGVLAPIMVKGSEKCPMRLKYYDPYKSRLTQKDWGQSKGHRNQAAMRYLIKMVLADIHREWRTLEGLPVRPMYQEEYLGHTSSRKDK